MLSSLDEVVHALAMLPLAYVELVIVIELSVPLRITEMLLIIV
jgi:hypothetical protein